MILGASAKSGASLKELKRAASDIAAHNSISDTLRTVVNNLRSVAKKLLKDDIRYRTLDTTNPIVTERLIGFEGVLDFLQLLGFESDEKGMKLVREEAVGADGDECR